MQLTVLPATSARCSTDKVSTRVNWLQYISYNMLTNESTATRCQCLALLLTDNCKIALKCLHVTCCKVVDSKLIDCSQLPSICLLMNLILQFCNTHFCSQSGLLRNDCHLCAFALWFILLLTSVSRRAAIQHSTACRPDVTWSPAISGSNLLKVGKSVPVDNDEDDSAI